MDPTLGQVPGAAPPAPAEPLVSSPQPNVPLGGNDPQAQVNAFLSQIKQLNDQIDAIAGNHPEASDDFDNAKKSLQQAMAKVAATISAPTDTPQPPVV